MAGWRQQACALDARCKLPCPRPLNPRPRPGVSCLRRREAELAAQLRAAGAWQETLPGARPGHLSEGIQQQVDEFLLRQQHEIEAVSLSITDCTNRLVNSVGGCRGRAKGVRETCCGMAFKHVFTQARPW
jgi:hypothetical protein